MSSAQREKAISRLTTDVPMAFGDRLVCLALYGSGTSEAFVPEHSNLNFAIILDQVTLADLKTLQGLLPAWHRLGVATPLLVDTDFLDHARDVFPIELEDLRSSHRILAGEDVLAGLSIDRADLRRQLEQEARGKLLRLRMQYAETAGKLKDVEALMRDSVKSLLIIVRGVLRLHPGVVPAGSLDLLDRFEATVGEPFSAIRQATGVRLGQGGWTSAVDSVFGDYLADVERLVGVVDRLGSE